MNIKENVNRILKEIPRDVDIVAATKSRDLKEIREVVEYGIKIIGENRVQEAEKKFNKIEEGIKKRVEWHMIGHLQRNKVKKAVKIFSCIQSVDSLKLAKEIDRRCKSIDKIMPILVQINIGYEKTKFGFKPEIEELNKVVEGITKFENLILRGIMIIEPYCKNIEETRRYFRKAKMLFDMLKNKDSTKQYMKILSMGMSNSYKIAIEEGSTMIRVGEAIFGPRKY